MRKSIYYLIANTFSLIVAAIVINAMGSNTYPLFGFNLEVTALKSSWEPLKYVALIEALIIILTTQDVVSYANHKQNNTSVPFTTLKNIIMSIVTIATVLYTWISVILEYNDYAAGSLIVPPYYFICFFIGGVVLMLVSKFVAKLNGTISISLVCSGLLLMISGALYEFFKYWYCLVPCLVVTGLVLVVPSVVSLILKSKKSTSKAY